MTENQRIGRALIVGGSTAGLSAAITLQRIGVGTEIVEIKEDWSVLGSGVTIMGAMLRALDSLGLAEECVRRGAGGNELGIYDADGNLLEALTVPPIAGDSLPSVAGIMRSELHGMLIEAAKEAGTTVRLGTTIEELQTEAEGSVGVSLSDGTSAEYDLVVGADGIHSHVRELLWGPEFGPHFTGQVVWRAVIPRPPDYKEVAMFYSEHAKAGFNAVSDSQAYLFLAQNTPETKRPPKDQWPQIMREMLAEFGGPVAAIRDQITDPETVDCRPLQANIVPLPWHRGSVVLVGDAVHATTPQLAMGAGLAIEDAIVLAELLDSGLPLEAALTAFAERRFDRCRMVVENSVQLGEWEKNPGPEADPGGLSAESWVALAEPI